VERQTAPRQNAANLTNVDFTNEPPLVQVANHPGGKLQGARTNVGICTCNS
jgi:hypothetical protein